MKKSFVGSALALALASIFVGVLLAILGLRWVLPSQTSPKVTNTLPTRANQLGRAAQPAKPTFQRQPLQSTKRQTAPMPTDRDQLPNAYDQPREAAEFFRLKRLPEDATELPMEKYLEAHEQMRLMPQYSIAENRLLPARAMMSERDFASLPAWTPLGPGNVGGRTRALLIHPTNPSLMYAAGVAGGIWKTTNSGANWVPIGDLLSNLAVSVMAMDPQNPNVIYAGTGEGFFNFDGIGGLGVFKTTDGGVTWTRLPGTESPDFRYVNDLVISPLNSQRLYAATRNGIYRSVNGGISWARVLEPKSSLSSFSIVTGGCLDLAIRTDKATDYLFASCGTFEPATIYRNTNAAVGADWTPVFSETAMGRTSLAIAPSDQNVVYAASASLAGGTFQDGLYAVFRSDSGGEPGSWAAQVRNADATKLNTVLFTNPRIAFLSECLGESSNLFANQGWYDNVMAVDPVDANRIWVGGVDLFRSDDGGRNWGLASYWWANGNIAPLASQYAHADHHSIIFHPQYNGTSNQTLFVGNDGGVFRTDNARAPVATGSAAPCNPANSAVTWASLNNGYSITQFYHGLPYPDGETFFGGTQDNGTLRGSMASGVNNWKEILGGDGGPVAIDPVNPNVLYASNPGRQIKKSLDGGLTFTTATTGLGDQYGLFINPFIMDPSDGQRLWSGGSYVWRSVNGATSWESVGGITPGRGIVSALAIAPTNANVLLVGMTEGQILYTSNSLTFSGSWESRGPRSGWVSSLAFDPTNSNIAYATYSTFGSSTYEHHVYRSTNAGANWTGIDGSGPSKLPDVPANSIVVDPTDTSRLFVATDLGVFVSTDRGESWAIENTGFANVPTESLAINTVNGVTSLFAFTHGRGVWRVPLGTGTCVASLTPASQTLSAAGASVNVNVAVSPGGCNWTAISNASWITVNSVSNGTGNSTVNLAVAPNNTSNVRVGTVTIAGKSFTVIQTPCDCEISPGSQHFAPGGGTGNVIVTANSGGGWQAISNVNWITINSGATGTGNGTVNFTVAANASTFPRTGTLVIAGKTFTANQLGTGTNCTAIALTPGTTANGNLTTSDCHSPIKGNGYYADRFSFTGVAGQAVTLTSNTSFSGSLFLIGPDGEVVAENSLCCTSNPRIPTGSGALALPVNGTYLVEMTTYFINSTGDYSLTLATTPNCTYSISPTSQSVPSSGGSGSVNITVGNTCAWQASSNAEWLFISSGSSGTGNGTVNFNVGINLSDNPRTGTLNVAGRTFTVTQAGQNCQATPIAFGQSLSGSLNSSDCRSAQRSSNHYSDRFTFTGKAGQAVIINQLAGNFVSYLYLFRPDGSVLYGSDYPLINQVLPADGTYTIEITSWSSFTGGNYTLTLSATTAGCTYEITSGNLSVGTSGGTRTIELKTSAGCQWQASSSATWITFPTSSGTGSSRINVSVAANSNSSPRSATIQIAGRTIEVTQQAEVGTCATTTISIEQLITGSLTSSDCRSLVRGSSYYADRFTINGTAGQTIAITLPATAFEPYLSLIAPDGTTLAARISNRIPSGNDFIGLPTNGTYIIEVSSYFSFTGGNYSLRVSSCTIGLSSNNQLMGSSGGAGMLRVETGAACTWQAAAVDNWITINSGANGTGNGSIGFTVAANSSSDQRYGKISVNGQTFTITQVGMNCPATPIAFGETQSGSLNTNDCRSYNRGSGYYADRFVFNGIAGQLVLIDQPSGDFDSYFFLRGPNGEYIDGQDSARIPRGGYLTLSVTGPYIIEVTSYSPNVTGNYTVQLSGSNHCGFALSSTSQSFAVGGGTGIVGILANNNCDWQAMSNADWITITSDANGKGNGAVNFTVAANTSRPRTASLNIAGRSFTVSQLGNSSGCTVTPISQGQTITGELSASDCRSPVRGSGFYADRYSFNAAPGQSVSVVVNTNYLVSVALIEPGGTLFAESTCCSKHRFPTENGFLTLPTNGTYIIEIASYSTDSLGNYDVTLNATTECSFALSPTTQSFDSESASGSVNLLIPDGCAWSARSNAPWLTILSGANGKGNGQISYSLTPNVSTSARTGTITIAGKSVTVTQTGRPCSAITPISIGQTITGALTVNDCASQVDNRAGFYADRFSLTGTAGQAVAISLLSAAFDSYLYLIGPTGVVLAEDDDGGTGLNARIPSSGGSFTLPVAGAYIIEVTSFNKAETGNYTLSLNPTSCVFSLSPNSHNFASAGGSGMVMVSVAGECQWSANSSVNWVTFAANATGTGNGNITFNVAPNTSAQGRSGTLNIAGQTVTITQASATTSVSAASFSGAQLAPESIVAAFGAGMATTTLVATTVPLPTTLAGTTVKVRDSAGVERAAPLFFVAPTQINYLMPVGTAAGTATVTITSGDGNVATGVVQIAGVAPGLFTANASGTGLAAATVLRVKADGSQIYEPVTRFDPAQNKVVAVPIDLGPETDLVFLLLFGSGFTKPSALAAVSCNIGGTSVEALYAGPQGDFVGLDQANVRLPRSLTGRGEVDVVLVVDGKTANTVKVNIK